MIDRRDARSLLGEKWPPQRLENAVRRAGTKNLELVRLLAAGFFVYILGKSSRFVCHSNKRVNNENLSRWLSSTCGRSAGVVRLDSAIRTQKASPCAGFRLDNKNIVPFVPSRSVGDKMIELAGVKKATGFISAPATAASSSAAKRGDRAVGFEIDEECRRVAANIKKRCPGFAEIRNRISDRRSCRLGVPCICCRSKLEIKPNLLNRSTGLRVVSTRRYGDWKPAPHRRSTAAPFIWTITEKKR